MREVPIEEEARNCDKAYDEEERFAKQRLIKHKTPIVVSIFDFISTAFLETSSSSSDEEDILLLKHREKDHRVEDFIESVINKYSEKQFKKNFRVERESAYYLIERYSGSSLYCARNYKGGRKQKEAETEILSFLWFCSNKNSIREVSNLFNLSYSTFHKCLNKVLTFMVEEIAAEVITFPKNEAEKKAVATEFEKVNNEPLSLAKAIKLGLRMARLPLDRFLQWGSGSGQSLTLNQMIHIMCDLKSTGDWERSLRHVPRRKIVDLTTILSDDQDNGRNPTHTVRSHKEKDNFNLDTWGSNKKRNHFK